MTDPDTPARLVEAAVERFGGLDIVVGNAGGPPPVRALEVDGAALHAAVDANLLSSIRLVQAALPHLRTARWGRIALITSAAVKQPIPALAYSNTARTGLWAWAKTAAQDLIDDGITLNLVCPGLHDTDRVRELGMTGADGRSRGLRTGGRLPVFGARRLRVGRRAPGRRRRYAGPPVDRGGSA